MHTGFVIRVNEQHVGRCIAAIRRRWESEARFTVRQPRERGKAAA